MNTRILEIILIAAFCFTASSSNCNNFMKTERFVKLQNTILNKDQLDQLDDVWPGAKAINIALTESSNPECFFFNKTMFDNNNQDSIENFLYSFDDLERIIPEKNFLGKVVRLNIFGLGELGIEGQIENEFVRNKSPYTIELQLFETLYHEAFHLFIQDNEWNYLSYDISQEYEHCYSNDLYSSYKSELTYLQKGIDQLIKNEVSKAKVYFKRFITVREERFSLLQGSLCPNFEESMEHMEGTAEFFGKLAVFKSGFISSEDITKIHNLNSVGDLDGVYYQLGSLQLFAIYLSQAHKEDFKKIAFKIKNGQAIYKIFKNFFGK